MLLPLFMVLEGCSDLINPPEDAGERLLVGTKGAGPEYYYWYHGEKYGLIVNKEYVNILIDTNIVKGSDLSTLCSELAITAKNGVDKDGMFKAEINGTHRMDYDYSKKVEDLRADPRILYVLPFFEGRERGEPHGSSQYFYLQLKELASESIQEEYKPYNERVFDVSALEEETERLGVRIVRAVPYMPDWYVLSICGSTFTTALEAADALYETGRFNEMDPAIQYVLKPHATNDPLFSQQWGLKNTTNAGYDINVEGAWTITTGSGIKIAIVDDNIDPNHSDLSPNIDYSSYDTVTGGTCTYLEGWRHGTGVAGIVAAKGNNYLQMAGVAYDSKIMRVRIIYGEEGTSAEQSASGISWAYSNGAEVINCSWGVEDVDSPIAILESAIVNAMTYGRNGKGTVVVFSPGNSGSSNAEYPSYFDARILVTGAINNSGHRPYYATYGAVLDVVAPGQSILTTSPGNDITTDFGGTTAAAPHVSGVAALMLAANPDLTREEVVRIIEMAAKKINASGSYTYYQVQNRFNGLWNNEMGYGLVDATAAVSVANDLASTPPSVNQGMDAYLPSGYAALIGDTLVMGAFSSTTAYFSVSPSWVNPGYTYYWYFRTSGAVGWYPSFIYVGNDAGVEMNIPRPISNSTLKVYCRIYNGTTPVGTASYTLFVHPDF